MGAPQWNVTIPFGWALKRGFINMFFFNVRNRRGWESLERWLHYRWALWSFIKQALLQKQICIFRIWLFSFGQNSSHICNRLPITKINVANRLILTLSHKTYYSTNTRNIHRNITPYLDRERTEIEFLNVYHIEVEMWNEMMFIHLFMLILK